MQYSIVTPDFTRASFIVLTLCARDYAVEAEVSHQDVRSMSGQTSGDGEAFWASSIYL